MGDLMTCGSATIFMSHWGWRWLRLEYEAGFNLVDCDNNFWADQVKLPVDFAVDPEHVADWCLECNPNAAPHS
jgi:hypothetical protein